MGRKSIAPQRQEEILDAFERTIEQHGFSGSSTRNIAEAAKMKQAMIAHYFGSKKELVDALVRRITDDYVLRMQQALGNTSGDVRVKRLLGFLFGPGLLGNKTKRNLIGQLLAAAINDETLRAQMHFMYQSFIEIGIRELSQTLPEIPVHKHKECVYGILCLAVGNDAVLSVDLPYSNRILARQCAEVLINRLRMSLGPH
ncbi:MAG: TetR/AcrR family transcriptional regulator [Thermodesulfobacteriota bacterium]